MRVELEPCIILHRRAYRDTSLILDVLSREHGRLALVARGARRPKARWRGLLEPLRSLRLSWSGRGEMQTLTAVETDGPAGAPEGERLYAAFYGAELVLRLTARQDPHPGIFDCLLKLIIQLRTGADTAPELRRFERDLLAELGYGLSLDIETGSGEPVRADQAYYYHPEHGLRISDACSQVAEIAIAGATLLALAADNLATPQQHRQARHLLAAALRPHLGDKPLRSAQTLRALRQLKASSTEQQ